MTALSINVNKIALIRNSRDGSGPNLVDFAEAIVAAGADGITVHPRPDQRHVRAGDCLELQTALDCELNMEGNPFAGARASQRNGVSDYPGFMALVDTVRPAQVTLVPDDDNQLTSDHGFDLDRDGDRLQPIIDQLKTWGCRVSLFMDPRPDAMSTAATLGADRIELYTESYARAHASGEFTEVLQDYQRTAQAAASAGLGINAGHDLSLDNLPDFAVDQLLEVSIGHAFTVDALRMGLGSAVQRYRDVLAG